jgi:hypothetical protein
VFDEASGYYCKELLMTDQPCQVEVIAKAESAGLTGLLQLRAWIVQVQS